MLEVAVPNSGEYKMTGQHRFFKFVVEFQFCLTRDVTFTDSEINRVENKEEINAIGGRNWVAFEKKFYKSATWKNDDLGIGSNNVFSNT